MDLRDLVAEYGLGYVLALNAVVDDFLGNVEGIVRKGQRDQGQNDDDDLTAKAVPEDVLVDGGFQAARSPVLALTRDLSIT